MSYDGAMSVMRGSTRPSDMMSNALRMTGGVPFPKGGADIKLMDAQPSAHKNIKQAVKNAQGTREKMFSNRSSVVQQAVDQRMGIKRLFEFII